MRFFWAAFSKFRQSKPKGFSFLNSRNHLKNSSQTSSKINFNSFNISFIYKLNAKVFPILHLSHLINAKYSKIPFDSSTTLTFINCIFTSIWLCFGIPPVFTNLLHVFYLKPFPSTSLAFNIIMNASLSIFFAMFCIA